ELAELTVDLVGEAVGPAAVHVGAAGVGGDGEAGRHRQPEDRRHLGQVGPLAAEQVLHAHRRLPVLVVEGVDVPHAGSLSSRWSTSLSMETRSWVRVSRSRWVTARASRV